MTHPIQRKSPARRWLLADVHPLERRELLTASVIEHAAVIPVHAEVSTKTVHAEKATHSTSVHAEAKKHVVTTETTTTKSSLKTKTTTTKPVVKAATTKSSATKVSTKTSTSLISSTLQVIKRNQSSSGPVAGAFAPLQIQTAYTVSQLPVTNEGQGQTIGIVDEYNDTTILSDANVFSSKYGLPTFGSNGGPTLTVYKDNALAAVTNSPSGGGDTSVETSLDVEWAHAMAPKANILLVEVPATGNIANSFAELLHGVQYAAAHGASAVSLSYGYVETNVYGQTGTFIDLPALYSQNQTYLATGAAASVAVTVSAGDYTLALYPSTSPNVIAVGGTSLHLTGSGQYSYETAWGGNATSGAGGGGTSAFFSSPTYQTANGVNFNSFRATPDVSLVADPYTGVSVYDSYGSNSSSPWQDIGGTSLASPLFAGMIALAQQDRVALSKPLLTSNQIDTAMYALYNSSSYSTYFHDVTLGNNNDVGAGYTGYNAVTGYDRATGIGSPIASKLIPYLTSL
jgi:subtilase family serine protease